MNEFVGRWMTWLLYLSCIPCSVAWNVNIGRISNDIHWYQSLGSSKWKEVMDYPFNNVSLSWRERVDDLVSRLTIDEMAVQMAKGGRMTYAPGIERLGIPPYPWGSECLRGDDSAGPATSFPKL